MKLVLHIGTHKTGTTAIQEFLVENRQALLSKGVYYALPESRKGYDYSSNFISNALVADECNDTVKKFVREQIAWARRQSADTIVISAENFYGMYCRKLACDKSGPRSHEFILSQEQRLVRQLKASIPKDVRVKVVFYFRRPDRFLESLYNQEIKFGIIRTDDIKCYAKAMDSMIHYYDYLSIWEKTFGRGSCSAFSYDYVQNDVIHDFLCRGLGLTDTSAFAPLKKRSNQRISRDLLEYKRALNKRISQSDWHLEARLYSQVIDRLNVSSESYQEFFAPEERQALLESVVSELNALQMKYALPPFPPFDFHAATQAWSPYPGLSLERIAEIEKAYNEIKSRPAFRMERALKETARLLRQQVWFASPVLDWVRKIGLRRIVLRAIQKMS